MKVGYGKDGCYISFLLAVVLAVTSQTCSWLCISPTLRLLISWQLSCNQSDESIVLLSWRHEQEVVKEEKQVEEV